MAQIKKINKERTGEHMRGVEDEGIQNIEGKSYFEIWEMLRQKKENLERVHLCGMGVA
jgi:hypothetical protein